MTPLGAELAHIIARQGPISLARYMALCLGHPEHGYYRTRDPLGRAGDFVTAPEASQIFGELLGLWAAEAWAGMGRPHAVRLAELGPGRGTLIADALRAIAQAAPELVHALDLHLVEVSPALRRHQQAALAGWRPRWHEDATAIPDGPLIVIANEFFDALPIRQFRREDAGWRERLVGIADGRLESTLGPLLADPPGGLDARPAPPGSIAEVSADAIALASWLGSRLAAGGGAALIVDYGAMASGFGDTFQAVKRHAPVDPLAEPGLADLTAHVNFAALAAAARGAGAAVYGPIPQGVFLNRLGLAARAAMLVRTATARQARDLARACERLIGERQMGTLFKALAIVGPGQPAPPGFDPLPRP
ncbi:MAG: class I SAM-dependent methyltransferase [Pseudomonadota bacterium]